MNEVKKYKASEVISRYIKLYKSADGLFKAECPFCDSRSRTLTVDDSKGLFHCSNDGSKGDVVFFVQNFNNVDFDDAVSEILNAF